MDLYFKRTPSPIGELLIYADEISVIGLFTEKGARKGLRAEFRQAHEKENAVIEQAELELKDYFSGKRKIFSVPVKVSGTDFQVAVWASLRTIGYGELRTYADVARNINRSTAVRAVGGAIGKNPVSIIIPCHRVIGSDASLTGFGGGLPVKEHLLGIEGHTIRQLKIEEFAFTGRTKSTI
jgi:methylated-DNA-[protein]-cysteine S-methyltransferase